MSYQSEYTGAQMEKVFSKVTNIVTGTVTFTASDAQETRYINNAAGHKNINYKAFVNLHMSTTPLDPDVSANYAAQVDRLAVGFRDLYPGFSYTFDYLLIE